MPNCIRCRKSIDNTPYCPYCGAKQQRIACRHKRANNTGSAIQRGKYWASKIVIGWKTVNDKLIPITLSIGGFPTKSKALEFLPVLKAASQLPADIRADALREAKQQLTVQQAINYIESCVQSARPASATFKEMYDQWSVFYEPRIDASTMNGHRAALAYFRDIWDIPFAELTADDLQDCLDSCPKGRRTQENMKQLCKRMYEYAIGRLMVQINCASYLYISKQDEARRPAMTAEHIEAIRSQIGIYPYAEYIYCLAHLGFRPNEMLSLKKSAYHNDDGIEYLIGGFKTAAGTNRAVTISPKIAPIIRRLLSSSSDYIFPGPNGEKMTDDYLRDKVFYPLFAKLNIQPIPAKGEKSQYVPYSCRHYFSDLLKKAPGPDKEKAALIGHSDYATTKRVYQSSELAEMQKITNSF